LNHRLVIIRNDAENPLVQCMTCRMLAETARSRARLSKFETRVFVKSRSSLSRSLSHCSSGLALGAACGLWELNERSGIGEEPIASQN